MKKDRKEKTRAFCARCRHQQLFIRAKINHPLHFVLVILTGGLWLVSWIALTIGKILRPWRCEHCGWHKPEFADIAPRLFHPDKPVAHRHRHSGTHTPPEPSAPAPSQLVANPLVLAKTSHLHP